MSIDIIQAILKMDHGTLTIREDYDYKDCKKVFKGFRITLECRFGDLKVGESPDVVTDVATGLDRLGAMYQILETSKVTVEKGVSF